MIKLLGIKRLITLSAIFILLIILLSVYFLWIDPARQDADRQVNALNGEIATLQNDINTTKQQIEETRRNIPYFNYLKKIEFFSEQDRFRAQRTIEDIQAQSGITSAEFTIGELTDVNEPLATQVEYRLVVSPIAVQNVQAFTDVEFYKLLYLMNNEFPGHIRLSSMSLTRTGELDQDVAQNRDQGGVPYFVTGDIEFQWLTMIEDPQPTNMGQDGFPGMMEGGFQ